MKYIESEKVKDEKIYYDGITERIPWALADGTISYLTEKYNLNQKEIILDIGCGNGIILKQYKDTAQKLYGLDIVDYLADDMKDKAEFAAIDLNFEKLPYEDQSMDVVFCLQTIEHLENPFLVMREAHRILKPNGLFVYSVPNPFQIQSKIRFLLHDNVTRWTKENDHLLFLTKDIHTKTYLHYFDLLESRYQKGKIPFFGRYIDRTFGKQYGKVLPRTKHLGKSGCFVLRKKS